MTAKLTRILVMGGCFPAVVAMILQCGCGRAPVPEPPWDKNRLLIEAMENIRDMRHGAALARLEKLKVIYPNNTNLTSISETEYDNIFIQKMQGGIDSGKIDAAVSIIERAEKIKPLNQALYSIKQQLLSLRTLDEALDEMEHPVSSASLLLSVKKAQQVISNYSAAEAYLPLLKKYEKLARIMAVDEVKNAKFDLASDLEMEKHAKKPDQLMLNILKAQTEAENAELY